MPFAARGEIISLSSLAAQSSTFWLIQHELWLPLRGTHRSGSYASDMKLTCSVSKDGNCCPVAHTPPQSSHEAAGGYLPWLQNHCPWVGNVTPLCCHYFRPPTRGVSLLVLHSKQMLEKLIEALAPADDSIKHGGVLQLE